MEFGRPARTVKVDTIEGVLDDILWGHYGRTIVNWWKRFGTGKLPDSIAELEQAIEPWARRVAA